MKTGKFINESDYQQDVVSERHPAKVSSLVPDPNRGGAFAHPGCSNRFVGGHDKLFGESNIQLPALEIITPAFDILNIPQPLVNEIQVAHGPILAYSDEADLSCGVPQAHP